MSVVPVVRMSTSWRETLRRWRNLLPLALGLAALNLQAQTCAVPGRDGGAAVSGVVNTYYVPGNGTYSSGSTSMALGGATGAATAVAPGDLVVLMQMQCANINSTNTANYGAGDGTGRGYTEPGTCQAGRYEYVRAGAATTASLLDLRGNSLSGTYVQDPANSAGRRTFQVIRVPQHAALTLGGTVNAPYWNGNTGGVVVLDVAGNLNWNGQAIDVSGRGFRGGGAVFWDNVTFIDTDNPPDWVTTLATMPHATKGEGIAGTPRFVYNQSAGRQDLLAGWVGYSNGDHGRGAPGNAGGGGDNRDGGRDNGGGGGGGNGGIGGLGGYGWKSSSWNSTFTASDVDLRGIGGGAFGSAAPHRVVMGGGGGAGGSNNAGNPPANSSGGAGGGIVIVRAGSMTGAGTVNADGADGQTQPVEDGAGGGGAGGSVVLMTLDSSMGTVAVNVRGGRGGDSWLSGTSAHGGGGGGWRRRDHHSGGREPGHVRRRQRHHEPQQPARRGRRSWGHRRPSRQQCHAGRQPLQHPTQRAMLAAADGDQGHAHPDRDNRRGHVGELHHRGQQQRRRRHRRRPGG